MLDLPVFRPCEGLGTFVGDVRSLLFSSKSQAARHFRLAHTTVVRYENDQLTCPPGYLAALMVLLAERRAAGQPDPGLIGHLLAETNRALACCVGGVAPFGSWEELVAAAAAYQPQPKSEPPIPAAPRQFHDLGEAPDLAVFCGRQPELATLAGWLLDDRCRLLGLLGLGGIGKTALAARLVQQVAPHYAVVIWRSLQNTPAIDDVLATWLQAVAPEPDHELPARLEQKILLLIQHLRRHPCLLILDNYESLFDPCRPAGTYREGYEGYGMLLRQLGESPHRSCLLITSREKPREFTLLEGAAVRSLPLGGLAPAAVQTLLSAATLHDSPQHGAELAARCEGNPLVLKLVAATIRDLFFGSIADFLANQRIVFGDVRAILDQQFLRLTRAEQALLAWFAIERQAVTLASLAQDMAVSHDALIEAMESLRRRSLLERYHDGFGLQHVVLEYATGRLIEQVCDEIRAAAPDLLISHPLIKADALDSVRESQVRHILRPVLQRLLAEGDRQRVAGQLGRLLAGIRAGGQPQGYGPGTILNMLVELGVPLADYDFSGLQLWQACLKGVAARGLNVAGADLSRTLFTETFGALLAINLSASGLLAAGTANGEILVWRLSTFRKHFAFQGHGDWVRSVAFNQEGTLLVSAGDDAAVRIWDLDSGLGLASLSGHAGRVFAALFSPDSRRVFSAGEDATVRMWDRTAARCLATLRGHEDWICALALSPDGRTLASAGRDRVVRLWDAASGAELGALAGHAGCVWSLAFSPDGALLASGSADRTVVVWDLAAGQRRVLAGHGDGVLVVAFSPDGALLASGGTDHTVRLWDPRDGRSINVLSGHAQWVRALVFSRDSLWLTSAGSDQSIRLWEIASGRCCHVVNGHSGTIWTLAFNRSGSHLLSSGEHQPVRLWEVAARRLAQSFPAAWGIKDSALSPDDRLVAIARQQVIELWDAGAATCRRTLAGHEGWVRAIRFSPDGRLLVSCSEDQTARLWDVATGDQRAVLSGHQGWIWSLAFSPDGRLVATGGDDRTVRVYELASGSCLMVLQPHLNSIWSLAFSPDSTRLASGCDDGMLRIWEVATGRCLHTLAVGAQVWAVAFDSAGAMVAGGGAGETVIIWDAWSGERLHDLAGHIGRVRALAFHPAAPLLACGNGDETIRLWDATSGAPLGILNGERPYEGMDISRARGLTEAQRASLRLLGARAEPSEFL